MKKLIIILAALIFTACNIDDNTSASKKNPGDTPDKPITRTESRQLTTLAWVELLNEIEANGKYVALDLTFCTRGNQTSGGGLWNDGSFYPDPAIPNVENSKNKIVSLILPEAASNIPDIYLYTDLTGDHYSISFRGFTKLQKIMGTNIIAIGRNAFADLGTYYSPTDGSIVHSTGILTSIDFPNVITIGRDAFNGCYSLVSANIPKVKIIEMQAFMYTKLQNLYIPDITDIGIQALASSLTNITLGKIAPWVGHLNSRGTTPRTIILRVPQVATGYGDIPNIFIGGDRTKNWGNAFRGMGWNPSNANITFDGFKYDAEGFGTTDNINTNITLKIEYIH